MYSFEINWYQSQQGGGQNRGTGSQRILRKFRKKTFQLVDVTIQLAENTSTFQKLATIDVFSCTVEAVNRTIPALPRLKH